MALTGQHIDDALIEEAIDPADYVGNDRIAKILLRGAKTVTLDAQKYDVIVDSEVPLECAEKIKQGDLNGVLG